ncbi:MAG: ATP-binding cassette domain-containing protein [Planctomycetota bacterium]
MLAKTDELFLFRESGGSCTAILENISIEVPERSFGASWARAVSGKTTLLYLIAGLEPVSAGAWLADEEIERLKETVRTRLRRAQVAFVFQYFHLLPNLTVRENIVLPPGSAEPGLAGTIHALGSASGSVRGSMPCPMNSPAENANALRSRGRWSGNNR